MVFNFIFSLNFIKCFSLVGKDYWLPGCSLRSCGVLFLQNQVSACVTLGSGKEYHFWLMTYVRYLVQAGRLSVLCAFVHSFVRLFIHSFIHSPTRLELYIMAFPNYRCGKSWEKSWNLV